LTGSGFWGIVTNKILVLLFMRIVCFRNSASSKQEEIVSTIVNVVDDVFATIAAEESPDLFMQLRDYYRLSHNTSKFAELTLRLKQRLQFVPIHTLSTATQQQIMRYAFRNEGETKRKQTFLFKKKENFTGLVWMLRGGRPGNETVEHFVALARKELPGIVVYDGDVIVGYSLGEFLERGEYEVVTAWTMGRYTGIGFVAENIVFCVFLKLFFFSLSNKW
jgi:hypothetical protein